MWTERQIRAPIRFLIILGQSQLQDALMNGQLTHWIYKHPIIDDLKRPGWKSRRRRPSYISFANFARALVDVLVPDAQGQTSLDKVRSSVATLDDDSGLKRPLLALIDEANGDITAFRTAVQGWFNDQMDRVSGWYKAVVEKGPPWPWRGRSRWTKRRHDRHRERSLA